MRSLMITTLVGVAACLLSALPGRSLAQTIVYQPPNRGAPSGDIRVGGAIRGVENESVALSVLAPDHIGMTAGPQPNLYWFVSDTVTVPIEATLLVANQSDPIMWLKLTPPLSAGIHAINLAAQGVNLRPGTVYQWFVAVVPDPENRSNDIVAGAEIELVEPPADVQAKLSASSASELPGAYASTGYWYDALQSLAALIDQKGDKGSRELRASLLDQVGLDQVARYDRSQP